MLNAEFIFNRILNEFRLQRHHLALYYIDTWLQFFYISYLGNLGNLFFGIRCLKESLYFDHNALHNLIFKLLENDLEMIM